MSKLKLSSILLFSLFISVNTFAGKADYDYKKKPQLQTNKQMVNTKTIKPASTSASHPQVKEANTTLDPKYKTKSQRQSNPVKAGNLNNSINSRSGMVSVDDEEPVQAMPVRSPLQMGGSNTKIGGSRGMVSVDGEEPVQAMPVRSPMQMGSSNTKIGGSRGMVSVDDEEPVQAMPAEVMQQQGQRSGFVRQ